MHDDWTSRMKEWISNSRCLYTLARSLFLTLLLLYRIKKSIWIQIHQIRLRIHGLFEWVKSSRELSTSIQNNLHTSAVKEENAFTWKYSFWCEEKCKKQTTKHSQKKPLKVSAFQHSYVDSAILIHTDDWAEFQWCDNNGFPSIHMNWNGFTISFRQKYVSFLGLWMHSLFQTYYKGADYSIFSHWSSFSNLIASMTFNTPLMYDIVNHLSNQWSSNSGHKTPNIYWETYTHTCTRNSDVDAE